MTSQEIWEECICDSLGDMNIFASDEVLSELMNLMMPNIKQAVAETTTPNKTRGSPEAEGKASRELKKKKGKIAKYLPESKVGQANMEYIRHQLYSLYSGISDGIADGIAIANGKTVFIVDSGKDNGKLDFGVRRKKIISDIQLRQDFIRSTNDDTISNGFVSNELSSRIGNKISSNIGRNLRRESGTELQTDTRKSENKQSGISQTNGDNRGLGKASREIDSVGNELTKKQAEYFKDSKVRDDEGNLKVMYHGSSESFTIFDKSQRNASSWYGEGFYFTENKSEAYFYGDKLFETYLNVENPYIPTADKILEDGTVEFAPSFIDDLKNRFSEIKSIKNPTAAQITDVLQSKKYDGIIIGENVVIFESNQAKNIDNKNPTSNPDIRFSRELDTAYLDAVKSGDMKTAQKMVDEVA